MTVPFDFDGAFESLTAHPPFPWQRRLFGLLKADKPPSSIDIPTGLGKTAAMAVWLLARAAGAKLPRRLVYVVDRRAVVDQATDFAGRIRDGLECAAMTEIRRGLGLEDTRGRCPLPISTLRGRHLDNREWLAEPAGPAIVVGTVDMIGSRLLFEGYGVSRNMRPNHAGLLGCDALVMLDEAHLVRPFEALLKAVEDGGGTFGPAAAEDRAIVPPFQLLPLSATGREDAANGRGHMADRRPFRLDIGDRAHPVVARRLGAEKRLTIRDIEGGAKALPAALAEEAWRLGVDTGPARVAVYCDSRADAEKTKSEIDKRLKAEKREGCSELFVGARRVREREETREWLASRGFLGGAKSAADGPAFLFATSAGEVGVDMDADRAVCDLVAWERMVQRFGRVNRRGAGAARIVVIDPGPRGARKVDADAVNRHKAIRAVLEALDGDASPGAILRLKERAETDDDLRGKIEAATTRPPLHPPLARALVDAWAMTSLDEHAGRPEVGPWLRGWVDEEPRTAVLWRRWLPVQFGAGADGTRAAPDREVEVFFEAAAPRTVELLETETRRVVDWLGKRARRVAEAPAAPADPGAEGESGTEDENPPARPAPMHPLAPVAFVLDSANRPVETLSLARIRDRSAEDLRRLLSRRRLVLDARIGGISGGLLDDGAGGDAPALDNDWGGPDEARDEDPPDMRVRLAVDDATEDPWRRAAIVLYEVDAEGEAKSFLVVEKRRGGEAGEDGRAIARTEQRLDEHREWVVREAEGIACRLGLPPEDRAMLVAAARHHDDGKAAAVWQRAFKAPAGGPYAKTKGPANARALKGFRHEFQSVLDAEEGGLAALDDGRRDLALHLVAAHHGRARPLMPVDGCDSLPPAAAEAEARRIALRYARLQRRWGPWGLAWWEALLRAADRAASRKLDEAERGGKR